ncbi:MAG: response regulator [Bdellovibrionales bacterium]|nr:response regulator [Bdellovibrionales bacterium]
MTDSIRILIVDDDEYFLEALRAYLSEKHYTVDIALNGASAKQLLLDKNYDLVLSDVRMPKLDGLELLEFVKANFKIPFILMTGFSYLLETKSAFTLGADDFLTKPFKTSELLNSIASVLSLKSPVVVSDKVTTNENYFCQINIEELLLMPQIRFDVFLKLSSEKFIKIGRAGDIVPRERILAYKGKGVEWLYIRCEDFTTLIKFDLSAGRAEVVPSCFTEQKRNDLITETETLIDGLIYKGAVDKVSVLEAHKFLSSSVRHLVRYDGVLSFLDLLNTHSKNVYAHGVGVSLYSLILANKTFRYSSPELFKLALVGFFINCGKK